MATCRLVNQYEELTLDKLRGAIGHDAHVFAKVRLADVFPISGSGISDKEYSYCLKAHFDFLVVDKNYMPIFSVEYDGKQHRYNQQQIENDRLKNTLCEKFKHPILRINSKYINTEYKGIDLLTYFVDVWFLEEAFYDAQEKGIVPYDEPFDACSILDDGTGRSWPYWISSDVQLKLQKLHANGKIKQIAASHWVGVDENKNHKCICWVEVDENSVVFVKTGMRQQLFPAVQVSDLLSMLAMFDLDKKLDDYFSGLENQTIDKDDFKQVLAQFCSPLNSRQAFTAGNITYPVF